MDSRRDYREWVQPEPDWVENTLYALGVLVGIAFDAIRDAWHWLECPPPAGPYREEDPLDPFTKIVKVIGYGVALLSAIGLTVMVLAYRIP
ncbi:MAG: hypothetical protein KBA91_01040 [Candidatus Moranbacteria bacterium]|jgi:hypothetical protein|nr:hypothetical protein [Candidatus Moranbacteria bacterium]